jgi:GcrA cell cycle regulator
MPMLTSVWDTVHGLVDRLKSLVAENGTITAEKLANELGNGLTRNAVIGKMRRMGLKTAKAKAALSAEKVIREHRKHGGKRLHISNTNSHPIAEFDVVEVAPVQADLDIPKEQRKTIMQLEAWHCRFPVGDTHDHDFFFCGAQKLDDLPYCKHHAMRCYVQDARRSPQYKWRNQA